jgi:alkylation response protein AidB-like acyl-CoA dehydrogenase
MKPELEPEELELILTTLKKFAQRRLDDSALLTFDKEERCPIEIIQELMGPEVGLHLAFIPTAYGGLGAGAMDIFQICETMASIDLGIATSLLGVALGTDPIRVGGTQEQKSHWMTQIAEEGWLVAYAVTEPSAGSDLAAIRTKAVPVVEDGKTVAYKISGNKQFITNGSIAQLYTVLAMTPGGPTFFAVERDTKGLEPGKTEEKHGIRASNTTTVSLDEVLVPVANLLGGTEGKGLSHAQQVFGYTRVMVASFGLGCGVAALKRAIAYGNERVQGGSLLAQKEAWTHKLIVPHAVALEASRAYIEDVSIRLDKGEPDLQVNGAIAKLVASESGNAAAEAAIQAHGGYGYIHEYMVEKIKRDARITCIYEGTSEILQRTIARDRWRLHLMTRGRYYHDIAERMNALHQKHADCGAGLAANACTAMAEIIELCREHRLSRNQHVLFSLGWLVTYAEVAVSFAQKAASAEPRTSKMTPESLNIMSRLWARKAAVQVTQGGLEILAGADALTAQSLRDFENKIELTKINDGLAGHLTDMNTIAKMITTMN